ncbi:terpene synthase family protein [Aspergillus affinis]|uniref:terpene synthase family protein n=1 Tax=Aspergillus affinis TaxID=1070780 RepID=UPI0022FF39C4|nr:pentalenene synthase [Aspergillus affinis]KAI9037613.1 pentalenene synthase [Aspergillus affinis]
MAIIEIVKNQLLPTGKTLLQMRHIPVRLPNMFVLFLSESPAVNPFYETIRKDSETWMANKCLFNGRSWKILSKTDFSYFCSISAPHASPERLRTVCDWGNWVFPFDDQFDNGGLKDDPERAQELINRLLAPMEDHGECLQNNTEDPLVAVHTSVWDRIVKDSPEGVQRRFASAMQNYCAGTLEQVYSRSKGQIPTLEEMLDLRRKSAGVAPLFALIEYAHQLDIPDAVFSTSSIREIERIGIDLVLLQNDLLSYCKEEKEDVTHNVVAICRQSGMSAQAAFDHIGEMLTSCYRDWYLALAELPSWGEAVDAPIQGYIRGVQNVVQANLHWSFRSGRYFGRENERVRTTGVVHVRPKSADLIRNMI